MHVDGGYYLIDTFAQDIDGIRFCSGEAWSEENSVGNPIATDDECVIGAAETENNLIFLLRIGFDNGGFQQVFTQP